MKRFTRTLAVVLLLAPLLGASSRFAVADGAQQSTVTIMAVGDIACDPASPDFNGGQGDNKFCQMKATSDLVAAAHPDAVLALGDNQYEDATLAGFQQSYGPTWGRFKDITYPVPGNHEYLTPGAAGYFAYFGSLARNFPGGYYSFNLGDWHLIALNSECSEPGVGGCGVGSRQEQWLLSDLAANRSLCTLAFWHEPRFTSGRNLNHPALQALWQDLYAFGAEIVLNGHDHIYERFAPQNPEQQADPQGIREFIVGGGGNNHQPNYGTIQPNSAVRDNTTYGVLRLTLRQDSYDWQYLPAQHAGNGTFTDEGTGACHGTAPGTENGAGPRAVPVVTTERPGATIARFTVDFTSARPGQAQVLFGPGPGCSGLVMTATGDQGSRTTHHVFVVTGNDLPGVVGDIGITPGTTYWYEVATLTNSGTEIGDNSGQCYRVTIPTG
jgi:acid phosphatase type 7